MSRGIKSSTPSKTSYLLKLVTHLHTDYGFNAPLIALSNLTLNNYKILVKNRIGTCFTIRQKILVAPGFEPQRISRLETEKGFDRDQVSNPAPHEAGPYLGAPRPLNS